MQVAGQKILFGKLSLWLMMTKLNAIISIFFFLCIIYHYITIIHHFTTYYAIKTWKKIMLHWDKIKSLIIRINTKWISHIICLVTICCHKKVKMLILLLAIFYLSAKAEGKNQKYVSLIFNQRIPVKESLPWYFSSTTGTQEVKLSLSLRVVWDFYEF